MPVRNLPSTCLRKHTQDAQFEWGPAAACDSGAIAVIKEMAWSDQNWLVRLDARGQRVAEQKLEIPKAFLSDGAIEIVAPGRAVLVLLNRKTMLVDEITRVTYDQPRWFECSWTRKKLEYREVAFWEGLDVLDIQAQRGEKSTSWTMRISDITTKPEVEFRTHVAYGFSKGTDPPKLHKLEMPFSELAHVRESENRLLAMIVTQFREAKLWRFTSQGTASEVAEITPEWQRRGEVSSPTIFRLRDGYLMAWRYYNKRIRSDERDGGIWFRTCNPKLTDWDEPRRLTDDSDITAGALTAGKWRDSVVIMWCNGTTRGGIVRRYRRVLSRTELSPAGQFQGELPQHLLSIKNNSLALTSHLAPGTREVGVRSRLYTSF